MQIVAMMMSSILLLLLTVLLCDLIWTLYWCMKTVGQPIAVPCRV